jgi:hypothetical protein
LNFIYKENFDEIIKSTLENIKFEKNSCMPKELLEDFVCNRLPPFNVQTGVSAAVFGIYFF